MSQAMLDFSSILRPALAGAAALAVCLAATPALGQAAPAYPGTIAYAETPSAALARNVRLLAVAPRSFEALIGAGRAALALGDTQAAVGFFGRAEEVSPRSPAPKAGTAAALVAMEEPVQALGYFSEAMRLGATQSSIGADRGLAYDLTSEPKLAQADYRAALFGQDRDEARRRLALSLAMGRDRAGALAALAPLMARRDPATERVRAFVLALVGDVAGARRVVEIAMPGAAANMEPFLHKLSRMSPDQAVAAVHFGRFPDDSAIKFSAVTPSPFAAPTQPGRGASRAAATPVQGVSITPPAPKRQTFSRAPPTEIISNVPLDVRPKPIYSARPTATSSVPTIAPTQRPVAAASVPPVAAPVAPVATPVASAQPQLVGPPFIPEPAQPPPVAVAAADPAPVAAAATDPAPVLGPATDRLGDIDALLASTDEPIARVSSTSSSNDEIAVATASPPSKFEIDIPADKPAAKKGKSKRDAVAEATAKKAKSAPKVAKSPGKYWVQLAGGAKTERMPVEYRRIKGKKPSLFAKRTAYFAELKGWTRLLVGPFKSEDESQEYVNQLAKADIDGFSWTSPTGQAIEKLPPK